MPPSKSNSTSLSDPERRKQCRRFYEPVLLIETLTQGYRQCIPQRVIKPDSTHSRPSTPQDRLQKFVYKLAHVCAREQGGDTVTSLAIMENDQGLVYLFACNQASQEMVSRVTAHVNALLAVVASSTLGDTRNRRNQKREILRQILFFNRPRIDIYRKYAAKHAKSCLTMCQKQGCRETNVIKSLRGLISSLEQYSSDEHTGDNYINTCIKVLDHIRDSKQTLSNLSLHAASHHVANDGAPDGNPWWEVQHSVSRLYSYEDAMVCFLDTQQEWPKLFRDFEVRSLPSSKPQRCPMGNKSLSAEAIIGRMTSDGKKTEKFLSIAEELQGFNIDKQLRNRFHGPEGSKKPQGFKPVRHSEVVMYDWAVHNMQAHNLRFFNGWRYIGSSKPTCRLCKYYIDSANAVAAEYERRAPIQVRPSHDNIYLAWSFPDAHGSSTSVTRKIWHETFKRMNDLLRDDAFRILEEKSCKGKRYDSNTYDGWSTRVSSHINGDERSVSRLSDTFSQRMRLQGTHLEDVSEDEDNGGALL